MTLGVDGTVEVWQISTGARSAEFGTGSGYGAALSPDGKLVLTWNVDSVTAWNAETGRRVATAPGPGYHIMSSGFRPDGAEIFVAGDNGTVDVWTGALGARTARLVQPAGMVFPTWAGPHRLVVRAMFGRIRVLDPALETEIATYDGTSERIAVAADGTRLAIAQPDGVVRVFSLRNTRLRRRFVAPGILGSSVSADGARVAALEAKGSVTLRDVDHDGVALPHVAIRQPIDLTPTRVTALTDNGDIVVLDSANGSILQRWSPETTPIALELTPDGRRALAVEKEATYLREVGTGDVVASIPLASSMAHVSADGSRVVLLDGPQHLALWDVAAARVVTTIQLPGRPIFGLFFVSPDGSRVAVPCAIEAKVGTHLYDTADGRALAFVPGIVVSSFAPNGDRMIGVGADGVSYVIRTGDGAELAKFLIEPGNGAAQITADGTRFTVVKGDGVGEVRSLVDGRTLFRFPMRPPVPQLDVRSRQFTYWLTLAAGVPDSLFVTGDETGSAMATWDIHLETRSPAEIARIVAERVPWRLANGRLVPVETR